MVTVFPYWAGYGEHPQPQHLCEWMHDGLGLARLSDARRKALGQPELPLDAAQQKYARIGGELAAIEAHAHLLARNRWKIEGQ